MRIRTIKPEFFTHEGLFELEAETELPIRLGFVGLWCAADREGRFKWEPRRLGVLILPYDNVDFSRVMDACLTRGLLVKYRVGDGWFGAIPSWHKHQIVNPRERASEIPAIASADETFDASSTRAPRVTHACSKEGKGKEGEVEGKEAGEKAPATRRPPKLSDDEWLASLKAAPAYVGIDIDREHSKATVWCQTRGLPLSRKRFVNWLNNAERPLNAARPILSPEYDFTAPGFKQAGA